MKTAVQFSLAITAKALNARAASSRKRKANGQSDRYDLRVFLLGLGLIDDEFKTCRKHLLANLAGSAAWKNGRPTPPPAPTDLNAAPDSAAEEHPAPPTEGELPC